MAELIPVNDTELQGFSEQAKTDFESSIESYKSELLREIGRIEAGQNAGAGLPEVTSRMVKEAELLFSRGSIFRRKRTGMIFLKGIAALSLFIAGVMADKESLQNFSYLMMFLAVSGIALLTNLIVNLKE